MGRILKLLLFLAIVGFAALSGYAYFGDLGPGQDQVTVPVTLDAK